MPQRTERINADKRLKKAIARRDAVEHMSKVGFDGLTVAEAGIVGELFQELIQSVKTAEEYVVKYGTAEYCNWKATLRFNTGTVSAYAGYTVDSDAEGFYHWKSSVGFGRVTDLGDMKFFHTNGKSEQLTGKFKKRASAKAKADREAERITKKYYKPAARKPRAKKAK